MPGDTIGFVQQDDDVKLVGERHPLPVATGFSIGAYDNLAMTYNANGDIETVTYFLRGEQLAMLTLMYDPVTFKLTSVTRS